MSDIREFKDTDRAQVVELLASLQGLLANLDPLEQHRKDADFDGEAYLKNQIEKVKELNGRIFVVENEGEVRGVLVGWINVIGGDSIDCYPQKQGYVADLFVREKDRSEGLGSELMISIEKYFKSKNCNYIALSYLVANSQAHNFYKKEGFFDYSTRMVKKLN